MAIDMTPEQREAGKANFQRVADGLTRRDFMKSLGLTAGVVTPVSAAAYFGYEKWNDAQKPVRTALIGSGDEGGVLIGEHNPRYVEIIQVCDIRPSNQTRIFEDERKNSPTSPRRGLKFHYGEGAKKKIPVVDDYKKVLENKDVEAVIIALPLHLHAQVAIDALKAGKHVLCEKLMAWNITQCKEMIKVAEETDRVLSIGHQRHYSMLYAHAVEVLKSGVLGHIGHIRALWHRNNALPKLDKDKEIAGTIRDSWNPDIKKEDRVLEPNIKKLGYKSLEELVKWRLYQRTGGGLMAELGSHQLDACSIFLGKVHPLAVSGVGGKFFYKDDRDADDHVFVTFEFPGPKYYKDKERLVVGDKNDVVVVTYSSINTNSFEPYGECVMGSRGTLVTSLEQEIMLYRERGSRSTAITVAATGSGQPVIDSTATGPGAPTPAAGAQVTGTGGGPVSRGYREEMEHFAYCVRMWNQGSKSDRPLPRCHGKVAMADAIIALTSNIAMKSHQRIEFKPEWFDAQTSAVPDAHMKPEVITA